jgi:hypothetical protein
MNCQFCGERPASRYVAFYQIIGIVIVFFIRSVKGDLCSVCIHKCFWYCTIISLLFGWWGVISFCLTPFFIILNVLYYVGLLGMESPEVPERPRETAPVRPARTTGDDQHECYLCGKPLQPDEREARVCRACRS